MSKMENYSALDRTLHRLAFAATPTQITLSDLEDRLYPLPEIEPRQPVFVTSLARAGTTLLLNILSNAPELASHTYRNMPFVLCPLLWDRITRRFREKGAARERSHGDGVAIDFDSPEAFEEVVWRAHWPEKYETDRVLPWSAGDRDADFEAFLRQHLCKILWLASQGTSKDAGELRYLSKNNANIARLPLLQEIFPDARIIVPVRNPWDHARSLLRQHLRFSRLHTEDGFSLQYMQWLGHFEFGAALRPIDFNGWYDDTPVARSPGGLAFWLTYWCNCYEAVLAAAGPQVVFIDYDELCRAPAAGLRRLAEAAALSPDSGLESQATRPRAPTDYGAREELGDPSLVAWAERLHARLREAANTPVEDVLSREWSCEV